MSFWKICKIEGVTIIESATLSDHIHMYVSLPPKNSLAKTIGWVKGKRALIRSLWLLYTKNMERDYNYEESKRFACNL